jgi:hypothetical protein
MVPYIDAMYVYSHNRRLAGVPWETDTQRWWSNTNDADLSRFKQSFEVKVDEKSEILFNMYCDISYLRGLIAHFSPQWPRLNSNVQFVE